MEVLGVIPARYASTRFPGKPLAEIDGKPMVQHVYERCVEAGLGRVIVATDDERILKACSTFGGEAEMTSGSHASGTERVAEIANRHPEFDIVLNIQGDEPRMPPATIRAVVDCFEDAGVAIATAYVPIRDAHEIADPNVVKLVLSTAGDALYFSRAPIPFVRDPSSGFSPTYLRHLGIYGFRREVLLQLTLLPVNPLERAESLEQLRWLAAGYRIRCTASECVSPSVDTPQDLAELLAARSS